MMSLLLPVIYIAFISLGLPDSLFGSAWPVMCSELNIPLSYAGIICMIISSGTIVSSLLSNRLTHKFGAGLVTSVSVAMTAIALAGFSFSKSFWVICLWAIPYGLGAGAVDSALNNYVALNYKARHMSWLHCFWGVGASVSPFIMGRFLTKPTGWHGGYLAVSIIQIVLTIILFASLPLWQKGLSVFGDDSEKSRPKSFGEVLKIKGVVFVLVAFFCYCALETTAGLWASSYLVNYKQVSTETAARFAALFYLGITFGRFLNGFIAEKIGDKNLIRIGMSVAIFGIIMVMIPVASDWIALAGLIIIGFGCAPVYPSVIHATPASFGKENSQAIVGIQMASAYIGSTFMPPIFGLIASHISMGLYPFYLLFFAAVMLICTEFLNKKLKKNTGL